MEEIKPSMQAWQEAWTNSDAQRLEQCYVKNVIVLPPNHHKIQGGTAIVSFFCWRVRAN